MVWEGRRREAPPYPDWLNESKTERKKGMKRIVVLAVVGIALSLTASAQEKQKMAKEGSTQVGSAAVPSKNAMNRVVSFNGIVSISRQNGKITRFRIGNMDEDMKTGYDIILDEKGKELAESKIMTVKVKGHVEVKNGKEMLVVEDFEKFTNTKETPKNDTGGKMTEIQKQVDTVLAKAGKNFLTIETKGKDDAVQVAREEAAGKVVIKVLINYPFAEPVDKVLAKVNVTPPTGWKVAEFEQGAFAKYDAAGTDAKTIAAFVDAIFAKLFKTQPDSFSIEKM